MCLEIYFFYFLPSITASSIFILHSHSAVIKFRSPQSRDRAPNLVTGGSQTTYFNHCYYPVHFDTHNRWKSICYPGDVKSTTTKSLVSRTIIAIGSWTSSHMHTNYLVLVRREKWAKKCSKKDSNPQPVGSQASGVLATGLARLSWPQWFKSSFLLTVPYMATTTNI